MTPEQYIQNLNKEYRRGIATEHTYRGDLKQLLETIVPDVAATNEPKRIRCGAPDYVLTRRDVPVGFIEAKDLGADLSDKKHKEQFDRYKSSLNNLIFTDYLDFRLYVDGDFKTSIKIGEIENGSVAALAENFAAFANLIKNFAARVSQTITSSRKLAEMMAGKARILSDVIERSVTSDERNEENSTLQDQMNAFKQILIHDITPKEFADVYAQTIAYGMFAARLHDESLHTFTRQEAAELIPKSNPFLRKLFGYIAGPDIDDRIKWIVDSLADIFRATDVAALLQDFGKATETRDPMIHFYETFLREYDPKLRKSRGVWYTPEPVVNFIVRAVDDVLKTEFNLPQGLADTSKTTVKLKTQSRDKRFAEGVKEYEKEVHRVQILDPATGTGTFLAEVVKQIHAKFAGQQGIWSNYVENHLIPRLNGFELLMASYAMAHLKLDLLLSETGYQPAPPPTHPSKAGEFLNPNSPPVLGEVSAGRGGKRLQIYLTNSLEEHHPDTGTLFASWLSAEANEANHIKRDTPVMCVIGNPPYSVSSSNKSKWIENLMNDYKKDLNEKNINPLSDDYLKFIRFGQHFIEKNGEGVLAYISNNSFIDGIIHRQMRKNLLETFDKIYILDLHGSSKKKETTPHGEQDKNVFDIQQGVSINIFVKKKSAKSSKSSELFQADLFGTRDYKYSQLLSNDIYSIKWNKLQPQEPSYYFVSRNYKLGEIYAKGFSVSELFPVNSIGVKTERDSIVIHDDEKSLAKMKEDFLTLDEKEFFRKHNTQNTRDWTYESAKNDLKTNPPVIDILYRIFDVKKTYYSGKTKGFHAYPRNRIFSNLLNKENLSLLIKRQAKFDFSYAFVTRLVSECCTFESAYANDSVLPLYLYPEANEQTEMFASASRTPNLDLEIVKQIADKLQLTFTNEKETTPSLRATPPKTGGEFLSSETGREFLSSETGREFLSSETGREFLSSETGREFLSSETGREFLNPNSPPFEGGVDALRGRGGNSSQINNLPYLKTFRKELRNNLTPAEARFWTIIKNKQFEGRKFRRQHSVGNYILDFYCPSERLAIELDGQVHFNDAAQEYDYERKLFLEHYGIKVLRFENKLVFEELEWMLGVIKSSFGWSVKAEPPRPADTPPKTGGEFKSFAPIDVLDYIYAVLHSPNYREKYKEFLKIDFPRVPYPQDAATFWRLVELGGELRAIHLLESPAVSRYITQYPVDGESVVGKIKFELQPPLAPPLEGGELKGKVWINDAQYFDGVPAHCWNFYIGGYQPAQKWLKDRKDRPLSFDDIFHYQKIICALDATARLMDEIGEIAV